MCVPHAHYGLVAAVSASLPSGCRSHGGHVDVQIEKKTAERHVYVLVRGSETYAKMNLNPSSRERGAITAGYFRTPKASGGKHLPTRAPPDCKKPPNGIVSLIPSSLSGASKTS